MGIDFQKPYSSIYLDDMLVAKLVDIDRVVFSPALYTDILYTYDHKDRNLVKIPFYSLETQKLIFPLKTSNILRNYTILRM